MPQLDPRQPPPPDYYARNVRYVLDEVVRRSGALLGPREWALIHGFGHVGIGAQRLFARLLTRRGVWLRVDGLNYAEVDDCQAALAELAGAGLVEFLPRLPADVLLRLLTRAEQQALFPAIRAPTKNEWICRCLGRYSDAAIRRRVAPRYPWIGISGQHAFDVCQVLFFGSGGGDLSTFVTQDLGLMRYESYELSDHTRPFGERGELERYLLCRRLSAWSKSLDDAPAMAAVITALLAPPPRSRIEQRQRDRVLNRVGRWHERRGEHGAALACYGCSSAHPARERRARILHRLGDEPALCAELAAMRRDPWCPAEEDFAERFPGRRRATEPAVTTVTLSGPTPSHIERHALAELTAQGGTGWHLENLLPLGLAGLAFWDEIFAPVAGVFSHPFQPGPQDLFWPDFARTRRALLEARIAQLRRPGAFAEQLRRTMADKHGITNRLVHWGALDAAWLECLLSHVPHEPLLEIAMRAIHNLERARSGFPDLLVIYGPDAWELVEVKGPGDQLQPAQRVWLRELAELGVPARVLRFKSP